MGLLEALGAPKLSNSLPTKQRCPPLHPLSWKETVEVRSGEGKGAPKSNLSSGICLIVWSEGSYSSGLFLKDIPARQQKERGFLLWLLTQCHFVLADRLGPPLDILLDSLNCTAFSVQWKMPKQHASTITGYTVSDALCCCLAQAAHSEPSSTAPSPHKQCHCPESSQGTVGLSGLSCNLKKQATHVLETSCHGHLGWMPRACSGYRLLFCCGFPARLSVLSDKTVKWSRAGRYCTLQVRVMQILLLVLPA